MGQEGNNRLMHPSRLVFAGSSCNLLKCYDRAHIMKLREMQPVTEVSNQRQLRPYHLFIFFRDPLNFMEQY